MVMSTKRLCPTCKSRRIQKNQFQNRVIKEYYCAGCERTFRGLTVFALLRIAFTGRTTLLTVSH
jgi:transposase-like protein